MEEQTDLQALILLVLLNAPDGGLDADQIVAEIERLTGAAVSIEQIIGALKQ